MSLIFWGNDQMTIKWVRVRINWNLVMNQRDLHWASNVQVTCYLSTGLNRSGFYLLQTILVCNYLTYRSWNSVGDSPPPPPHPNQKASLIPQHALTWPPKSHISSQSRLWFIAAPEASTVLFAFTQQTQPIHTSIVTNVCTALTLKGLCTNPLEQWTSSKGLEIGCKPVLFIRMTTRYFYDCI